MQAKASFERSVFIKQHGVVSQKTQLLINTAERTSHMGPQFDAQQMTVGVLPICRQTPLLSTPAPETTYCPVLTFRADRRDLILMLRLEEQNGENAGLLLPSKSIVALRRVGRETSSCVHAASALFLELSHPPLQRSMRGEEEYESLREVEFGISQKGNTRNGRQQMPSCLSLILQNKKKNTCCIV